MNTQNEIQKLFSEFQTKVIQIALWANNEYRERVRALLVESTEGIRLTATTSLAKRNGKPAKARKVSRGRRHCAKCGSVKHDARNCTAKGKKAALTIAKAA